MHLRKVQLGAALCGYRNKHDKEEENCLDISEIEATQSRIESRLKATYSRGLKAAYIQYRIAWVS